MVSEVADHQDILRLEKTVRFKKSIDSKLAKITDVFLGHCKRVVSPKQINSVNESFRVHPGGVLKIR